MTDNLVWQVGEITVTRLVEMSMTRTPEQTLFPRATVEEIREMDWLVPHFCTPEGGMMLSIHALLVQTPDMRLVVDTCVGDNKPRAAGMFNMLNSRLVDRMREIGWAPETVDAVICTHMHVDHVGWNTVLVDGKWVPTFPNARYFFAREEYENALAELDVAAAGEAASDEQAVMSDSVRPIFDAGLAVLVDTDAQIAPGLRLMPTPGHTPAHVSVVLESQGNRAIITGDMMHHPSQITRPDWAFRLDWDPEVSTATREQFIDSVGEQPILVIGSHFPAPTAGYVTRDSEQRWVMAFDRGGGDKAG